MPRSVDVGQLITELEPLVDCERPQIVLDADGTLWSGDVGYDLFAAAVRERVFKPEALPRLCDEAARHGVGTDGDATAIAERLLGANVDGRYPNGPAFEMMGWAFAGFTPAEMRSFAEAVVAEERVTQRVFPFVHLLFDWARRRGVTITVCSASPRDVVEAGVAHLDLGADDVIAVTVAVQDGRLADRLVPGPSPYAEGKVARLEEARGGHTTLAGFGDSAGDAHFLRRARLAVGVRPQEALVRVCEGLPNFVLLEG